MATAIASGYGLTLFQPEPSGVQDGIEVVTRQPSTSPQLQTLATNGATSTR